MKRTLAIICAVADVAGVAGANGRFPSTTSVFFKPGDATAIFAGSTFGLLVSRDDGASWRWICEAAINYNGNFDPAYGVTASGAILAGTYHGLSISRDGGCSWGFGGGEVATAWISDLRITSDGTIWLTTASGTSENHVYSSRDDGASFQAGGHRRAAGVVDLAARRAVGPAARLRRRLPPRQRLGHGRHRPHHLPHGGRRHDLGAARARLSRQAGAAPARGLSRRIPTSSSRGRSAGPW